MHSIKIKRGLDIPLPYKPIGEVKKLPLSDKVGLDLVPFSYLRLCPLVKVNEKVKKGQPIVSDKNYDKRLFLSPASGTIEQIKRGQRRALVTIVINQEEESDYDLDIDFSALKGKEEIIFAILQSGLSPYISKRPFDLIANEHPPQSIFVQAVNKKPYATPLKYIINGNEKFFSHGLKILEQIAEGNLHIIFDEGYSEFKKLSFGKKHHITGPYPSSSASIAIAAIDPIQKVEDVKWVLDVTGVITLGKLFLTGKYHTERIVGIGGCQKINQFYQTQLGCHITNLLSDLPKDMRIISGDPLTGRQIEWEDFLGFYDQTISLVSEKTKSEFFYFLRAGWKKYTASHTYLSAFFRRKKFSFTTEKNGEERAFIDPMLYQKVMPLKIPVAHLVKAIITDDYSKAEQLGILDLSKEDFALPSFICPSKIDMVTIVDRALKKYALDLLPLV